MKKKTYITLFILSIIFLGIGGTLAAITASGVATNITQIKSGNLTMTVDGGGSENVSLMPATCTSEYAIKKTINASAVNTSGGRVSFSIGMNITTLGDGLKRSTMKYALTTSATSCTDGLIASGNFADKTANSDVWLIKNDYDNITNTGNNYNKTYYLYIWLDSAETQNVTGSVSVTMKGSASNNPDLETEASVMFYDVIKGNADTTTQIDFSQTSEETNTNGIYTTTSTDSGNPVYYYRGNVDNRLIFANFCWRIVRTTETGGVKIVYDGLPRKIIEESSYIIIENGGDIENGTEIISSYPFAFDTINKKWTSTNDTGYNIITFSVATAGDYALNYTKTGDSIIGVAKNGETISYSYTKETDIINLLGLTTDDVIMVIYEGAQSSNVVFSVETYVEELSDNITCNNTGAATTIGNSKFNSSYNDAKYVGYMYGSSIDDTNNTTDSTAKTFIDNWYQTNLTSYTLQLEDTVFCNDRTYRTDGSNIYFAAYDRLYTNKTPTLQCTNTKDKFTVNESNGNGDLTYPIGLLSADEIALAGGVSYKSNASYYLKNSDVNWVGTAKAFVSEIGSAFYVYNDGSLVNSGFDFDTLDCEFCMVRPAVSLKPGIAISGGTGTATDPYIVG